jgi:ergothioneine biosynthesis protein EgtB
MYVISFRDVVVASLVRPHAACLEVPKMNTSRKGALARAHKQARAQSLPARFEAVRAETERLAAPLSAEDQTVQSMTDASPAKWHRAHTSWFFETFILKRMDGYRDFHPDFSFLFNSYYDAVGARHPRPQRGLVTRPSCGEIAAYRGHVDTAMLALMETPAFTGDLASLVELGLHHEQQHQELMLTDVLHAFAQNSLGPAYQAHKPIDARMAPNLSFADFEGGLVEIGHDGEGFAFDNEGPRHKVWLEPFRLARRLVTNREWLEFIDDGGYRDPRHWLSDGWACLQANGWTAPLYWQKHDSGWVSMTLSGLQPLNTQAPVTHVSFYEADAFARWCGKRLPRETEWEHAAAALPDNGGNFRDSGALRPLPASGNMQLFGDCWEWTGSPYAPYPGYCAAKGAVGEYNGKFMINQMVLRGGSCVTAANHIRASYRNFFYPHQRWQFAGLRLAETIGR